MKQYLLAILFGCCCTCIQAQYYEQAVGLRLGGTGGVTYKKYFTEFNSAELLLSGRNGGLQITGLRGITKPLDISENLFLVYGYGAHLGYERATPRRRGVHIDNSFHPILGPPENIRNVFINTRRYFTLGFDGTVGLEYRFAAPFTIGLDIKPYFNFIGFRYARVHFGDVALTTRFTF